jgi:hypothetical protein
MILTVCEGNSVFAWRSLDPKMTAQVILVVTQRLSRGAARPSNTAGCAESGLRPTGWLRPAPSFQKNPLIGCLSGDLGLRPIMPPTSSSFPPLINADDFQRTRAENSEYLSSVVPKTHVSKILKHSTYTMP